VLRRPDQFSRSGYFDDNSCLLVSSFFRLLFCQRETVAYVDDQGRMHPLKTIPYRNKDETGKIEAQRGGQESSLSSMSSR
jgi:hypothetical protein